jgi:L-ascorbate metabolism protein UlaG (beta-lactamase superfamily)
MVSSTRLTYVGHATVLIEIGGLRIITDPLLRNRIGFSFLQRCAPEVNSKSYESIDAVLISHMHPDHLDIPSLRLVDNSALLIAPKGVSRYLKDRGFDKVKEIRIGECIQLDQVKIRSTPAKHSGSRHPFGPSGECLGFVIEGKHSIYFAGDTDLFLQMSSLGKMRRLDVALLPVWGWGPTLGAGHLDPLRAAQALKLLHPKISVPIHWGTFCPIGANVVRPRFLTYPPYTFAHHASQLSPEVEVRVIAPGEYTQLVD